MGLTPKYRGNVTLTGHGKRWQDLKAEDVQAGDIIPGMGEVKEKDDCYDGINVQIRAGVDGDTKPHIVPKDRELKVFR